MIAPVSTLTSSVPLDLARAAEAPSRPSAEEAAKAARQFEAILVRQLISPAVEPLMSSGLGGSESGGAGAGVFGYFLTDTLANSMTEGGGLGLAGVLSRQLTPSSTASLASDES